MLVMKGSKACKMSAYNTFNYCDTDGAGLLPGLVDTYLL